MQYSFFKFSLLFVFIFIPLLLFALYASAQQETSSSIKFGNFYPPTITNTPEPTKISLSSSPIPSSPPALPQQPEKNQNQPPKLDNTQPPLLPPYPQTSQCSGMIAGSKQIIDSLSRGFWRYYNYSSLYSKFFDKELYRKTRGNICSGTDANGNTYPKGCTGMRPHAFQLFWCTWLPMKTYERAGISLPQNLYSVIKMREWFRLSGRHIPGNTIWQDIPLGSAVFFRHKEGGHHVALVTSKNRNYITIYESNSPVRTRKLTVGRKGTVQGENNDTILGFGIPPFQCEKK